jgi:sarcosine oxidase, subunit gamma
MSESPKHESPLVRQAPAEWLHPDGAVALRERLHLGYINLRGDPADSAFLDAVTAVLGLALPLVPNTTGGSAERAVFWLGPDEWLIVTAPDAQLQLTEELEAALQGQHVAITDLSGGQCAIAVSGPRARELLAKGCGLDLHPRKFPPGRCAQTVLAKAGVLICHWDESPAFEVLVRRSFADHLWSWLRAAAQSFPDPA